MLMMVTPNDSIMHSCVFHVMSETFALCARLHLQFGLGSLHLARRPRETWYPSRAVCSENSHERSMHAA